MKCPDTAGMPGSPCLQQVEGFRAAHLPDGNTIGPKPQRRTDEIGERGRAVFCAQRDQVRRRTLQLARILDQHDAVAGLGDLGEESVDQRGLAGRGAAGDEHILAVAHGDAQQLGLRRRHDAGADIVVEGEDGDGMTPNGEARRCHHRRHQALEALPAFRQLGRDAWATRMDLDTDMMRNEAHDALGVCGRDATAGIFKTA